MKQYMLGIDGGTTGMRAGIYEKNGREAAFCSVEYGTRHPFPGAAEQDPDDWWKAIGDCVRGALAKGNIKPGQIAALSMCTTSCSVLVCTRDGRPLRPCLIWMDVRSAAESDEINAITGESLSPEWMPAKLLWLKRHEPEVYRSAEVFCEYQDYMMYRLTGRWSININNSCNWGYNADRGDFDRDFYEKIGLSDAVGRFPAEQVFAVGDVMGGLVPEAAAHMGLLPETPVVCGGIDSSIGILGMGIAEAGKMALCTGSSNLAMVLTPSPVFGAGGVNCAPHHLLHGFYTDYRGQTASGSILQWFKREFCRDLGEDCYRLLDAEAALLSPGSEGLVVLDYWQGNRHPYLDGDVRGMIYGLSLNHTRAHVFRALMEGICCGTAHLIWQFSQKGYKIEEMVVAGGFARSELLLRLLADICGVGVKVPRNPNSGSVGTAVCAAAAVGWYGSLGQAAEAMVAYDRVLWPQKDNAGRYAALFELYRSIYPELEGFFKRCRATAEAMR